MTLGCTGVRSSRKGPHSNSWVISGKSGWKERRFYSTTTHISVMQENMKGFGSYLAISIQGVMKLVMTFPGSNTSFPFSMM